MDLERWVAILTVAVGLAITGRAAASGDGLEVIRGEERGGTPRRAERAVVREPSSSMIAATPAEPGTTLLGLGARGPEVRELQARLRQVALFLGRADGVYGAGTAAAVSAFQEEHGLAMTGAVDHHTLIRLDELTRPTSRNAMNLDRARAGRAPLDPRCLSDRALCVDKSSNTVRWVVDEQVQLTLDARMGGNGFDTREGQFSVYAKSRDHVSSLYGVAMPFAIFYDGGQAVHYSPDFVLNGYDGASHGCVNVRDYYEIAWLFDQIRTGDRVVVYRSGGDSGPHRIGQRGPRSARRDVFG
jgi:hypothetical protein